jgi:nucleoside-diphosphate-sugar epimerase
MTSSHSPVAVTGASGFLGSTFCQRLSSDGVSFLKILRSSHDSYKEDLRLIRAELSAKDMASEFSRKGVRTVFHFATHFTSSERFQDSLDAYAANITYSQKVFEAAILANCRFVNFNSYWQLLSDSRANLPYSRSKELFRMLTLAEGLPAGMVFNIFLPDTFGPRDRRGKIVEKMTFSAIHGDDFSPSHPDQRIDLTFAPRLASFLVDAMEDFSQIPSEVFYVNYSSISLGFLSSFIHDIFRQNQFREPHESWTLANYENSLLAHGLNSHGINLPVEGLVGSQELLSDLTATISAEI